MIADRIDEPGKKAFSFGFLPVLQRLYFLRVEIVFNNRRCAFGFIRIDKSLGHAQFRHHFRYGLKPVVRIFGHGL